MTNFHQRFSVIAATGLLTIGLGSGLVTLQANAAPMLQGFGFGLMNPPAKDSNAQRAMKKEKAKRLQREKTSVGDNPQNEFLNQKPTVAQTPYEEGSEVPR